MLTGRGDTSTRSGVFEDALRIVSGPRPKPEASTAVDSLRDKSKR